MPRLRQSASARRFRDQALPTVHAANPAEASANLGGQVSGRTTRGSVATTCAESPDTACAPRSSVERTLAAQALLAGIAERGADAVGYALPRADACLSRSIKQRLRRERAAGSVLVPARATKLLVHVRDYTKGHPRSRPTTTPSGTAPSSGIHNGIIVNDDELLAGARFRARRAADDRRLRGDLRARRARVGSSRGRSSSSAARWRPPGSTSASPASSIVARGVGRPLWTRRGPRGALLRFDEGGPGDRRALLGLQLRKREIGEGTLVHVSAGVGSRASASGRTGARRGATRSRPCARRTRAAPACASWPRWPL